MQVQSISFFLSDPLLLPCVVETLQEAVAQVEPATAAVAGVGHYEIHEPLLAKYRPPTSEFLLQHLGELRSHVVVAATVKAGEAFVHGADVQPFRYRNWLFAMAGQIDRVDGVDEVALPIPTYIHRNIRGGTVPEVLFHQVLAFLHRQGLLAGERWEMSPLRKALKSALSLEGMGLGGEHSDCSMILTDGRIMLGAALGRYGLADVDLATRLPGPLRLRAVLGRRGEAAILSGRRGRISFGLHAYGTETPGPPLAPRGGDLRRQDQVA